MMDAARNHSGRFPSHVTAQWSQAERWADEAMEYAAHRDPKITTGTLQIMRVRVIERAGPTTLIWSETL